MINLRCLHINAELGGATSLSLALKENDYFKLLGSWLIQPPFVDLVLLSVAFVTQAPTFLHLTDLT